MASLRRSSVKLSSLGRGNGDLKMVITQLKTVKENANSYAKAQEKAMADVEKWALKEENRAIQDCSQKLKEVFDLWYDAQFQFAECLDELRHNFKMILEGEQGVANAKGDLDTAESRETKLVKELKKLNKKSTSANPPPEQQHQLNEMKDKLEQATREKEIAKIDVDEKIREQEAVKMIRFKVGFNKVVVGYLDLAEKSDICFTGGHEIIEAFPDVDNSDIHKLRYSGTATTLMATEKAKERIKHFRSNVCKSRSQNITAQNNTPSTPSAPPNSMPSSSTPYQNSRVHSPRSRSVGGQSTNADLPPPYTEIQPPINPYFNDSSFGNTSIGDNPLQQNSSFTANITNGSNNNSTNRLNDSQLSNSHTNNYNASYSSNNCSSAANLSTLSQSTSSYYPSPITRNGSDSANTSQQSYHGNQARSIYPNLNTSGSEAHPINTPGYQQHMNELRNSINRLSLGNNNQF